ncbi:hypothetical protein SUGI_0896290 [Cryptomeria japonica]|nr:hypothetical protein SUGI_0896290 [Cryptomeria japonica]
MKYISPATPYNGSHLGWRSPALYLFIGVAGMLALIGFASFILVCTWCRMVTVTVNRRESTHEATIKPDIILCNGDEQDQKVLVIMPGEHKPTFLATQLSSSVSCSSVENA